MARRDCLFVNKPEENITKQQEREVRYKRLTEALDEKLRKGEQITLKEVTTLILLANTDILIIS